MTSRKNSHPARSFISTSPWAAVPRTKGSAAWRKFHLGSCSPADPLFVNYPNLALIKYDVAELMPIGRYTILCPTC